ncbi:MAG: fasciclin domain-containing protein, partial [Litorimonas sp.]
LSTLVAAVQAADLVDALSADGPFTVFAPTNDAFGALPAGTVDTLLMPENKDKLSKILTSHVVSGSFAAADVIALAEANGGKAELTTLSGAKLKAYAKDGKVYIKDENGGKATVATADVTTSNGTVHVVSSVLLPK